MYRLEQEFNRQGLKLSRQAMANWLLKASEKWLQPVYDVLHEQLCRKPVLHADETTLQVLKEPGRSSTSKSYMWLYRTSGCAKQAIVLYEYQPTRKAEHAEAFLKGFSGWLHADGYQGYHKLPGNIRVVGCWAHARRKFDEALQTLPKEMQKDAPAAIGECYCSRLFKLEQALAELTPEERYEKRLEQEKPVLDVLLSWANAMQAKTAPKSALGRAIPLPVGAVAVFDEVSGGWPTGAEQQPRRTQHQALRDGQKELAVCQYSRWRASQCSDLQSRRRMA